jgi:hypothetical protein
MDNNLPAWRATSVSIQPQCCEIDPYLGELPPAVVLPVASRGLLFAKYRDRRQSKGIIAWYGMTIQDDRSRERRGGV